MKNLPSYTTKDFAESRPHKFRVKRTIDFLTDKTLNEK